MTRQEYEECGKAFAQGFADGVENAKKIGIIEKGDFISRTAILEMFNDEMNRLEERKREFECQNMNPIGIVIQQSECNYMMEIVKSMQSMETGIENLVLQLEKHYNIIQNGEDRSCVYGSRVPVFEKDYNTSIKLKSVIDMLKGWLDNERT